MYNSSGHKALGCSHLQETDTFHSILSATPICTEMMLSTVHMPRIEITCQQNNLGNMLTHWSLGDLDVIVHMQFPILFNWLASSDLLIIIPSDECHKVLTDDKSTLVQVMAWCCQAPSHYLSQCWLSYMSPYWSKWINPLAAGSRKSDNKPHSVTQVFKQEFNLSLS